MDIQVKILLKT